MRAVDGKQSIYLEWPYKERFDFHCTAHDIPQRRRKALFLTRIGREAFVKLKTLVSPTLVSRGQTAFSKKPFSSMRL